MLCCCVLGIELNAIIQTKTFCDVKDKHVSKRHIAGNISTKHQPDMVPRVTPIVGLSCIIVLCLTSITLPKSQEDKQIKITS